MARRRPIPEPIRTEIAAMAGVRQRRMFGAEAYFVGSVMFAFLAGDDVVLRLPEAARRAALADPEVRPWLGALPEELSGWVAVPADIRARPHLAAAHAAARAMARSAARKPGTTRKRRKVRSGK